MADREGRAAGALDEGAVRVPDAETVAAMLPRRKADGHKGDFGRVLIAGGAVGYTGAPILAARGALRSGAGLVTAAVPASIYQIAAVKCDEAMALPLPVGPDGALSAAGADAFLAAAAGKDAVLIGPGLGRSAGAEGLVCRGLEELACPVVLDADGLNAAAGHMDILKARRGRVTVLTPHEGEFARLGGDVPRVRIESARAFAAEYGCVLVLKGHRTVTALPDGTCWVNHTGNCGMAKGGSGDILGGMLLGLIGQGMTGADAAVCAVWVHGRAGDLAAAQLGERGMLPTELLERVPLVFRALDGPDGQTQD